MAEMVYRNCQRSDVIMSFGVNCASKVGDAPGVEDGGKAALKWMVENASATDTVCADEVPREGVAIGQKTPDPWRRNGETVLITVTGSPVTHEVEFGPTPDYKIIRWQVNC
jgi:hypothetical protein